MARAPHSTPDPTLSASVCSATAASAPAAVAPGQAAASLSLLAQVGLLAGPFLSMVDSNIVNVALPSIADELRAPLALAQWVVSVYLLAAAAMLVASAYFAKRFGTQRFTWPV